MIISRRTLIIWGHLLNWRELRQHDLTLYNSKETLKTNVKFLCLCWSWFPFRVCIASKWKQRVLCLEFIIQWYVDGDHALAAHRLYLGEKIVRRNFVVTPACEKMGACSDSLIQGALHRPWLEENTLMNGSNMTRSCVVNPFNETERLTESAASVQALSGAKLCVNYKFPDLQTLLWPQGWV